MNFFDYFIIGIVIFSIIFAFFRGFIKSSLSFFGWILAALLAVVSLPITGDFFSNYIGSKIISDLAAIICTYVALLIVFTIINYLIFDAMSNFTGSAIDKSFGAAFGLARGYIIGVVIFLAIALSLPIFGMNLEVEDAKPNAPSWLTNASTYQVLKNGGDFAISLIPNKVQEDLGNTFKNVYKPKPKHVTEGLQTLSSIVAALPYPKAYNEDIKKMANKNTLTLEQELMIYRTIISEYRSAEHEGLIRPEKAVSLEDIKYLEAYLKEVEKENKAIK